MEKINYINNYLKNKFGERVLKIGIDGGFTCPNRDGSKGTNGCIFCSERGSGEHLHRESIKDQLERYFSSYKATRANAFILYFQNFSNTYDTLDNLKKKYDEALNSANEIINEKHLNKRIVGLSIATRPDCIDEDICKLLNSYNEKIFAQVELGLQTSNDTTGDFINRKYASKDFSSAVSILNKYKIDVVAHIMIGLPGETHADIINTVEFLNHHNIQGIKIHSTYIVKNTVLEKLYNEKKYSPISLEEYLFELEFILNNINKNVVIHRISGDAPKDLLIAPEWNLHKKWVLNEINKKFHCI